MHGTIFIYLTALVCTYMHALYIQTVHFYIMSGSPSNVMVEVKSCNSANVTWMAPEPRVCDGVTSGYNLRYRL